MPKYIVFDVETPNRYNNRMSAIGISIVENGKIVKSFFSYVDPEQSFDWFNTKLTGIDARTVAGAPTFPELWKKIEPILSSGVLVAHNASFDMGVLKKCLKDYNIQWKSAVPYCCTVQIGRPRFRLGDGFFLKSVTSSIMCVIITGFALITTGQIAIAPLPRRYCFNIWKRGP